MAYKIDNSSASASKPARGSVGPQPNGFFQDTSPSGGTVVPADFLNMVQDELCEFIKSRGITLDKADDGQLEDAIKDAFQTTTPSRIINPFMNYAHFRDEKPSGTNGQAAVSGSFVKRNLIQKVNNISGASIASDIISMLEDKWF